MMNLLFPRRISFKGNQGVLAWGHQKHHPYLTAFPAINDQWLIVFRSPHSCGAAPGFHGIPLKIPYCCQRQTGVKPQLRPNDMASVRLRSYRISCPPTTLMAFFHRPGLNFFRSCSHTLYRTFPKHLFLSPSTRQRLLSASRLSIHLQDFPCQE